MNRPIYLDNHATTPVDPRVFAAMEPYLKEQFGNASSKTHSFGLRAKAAVNLARRQVSTLLEAKEEEIYFTSGATESNNLAILGLAEGRQKEGNHIITVTTEHRAVLDPCLHLESLGFQVTYLPVDSEGRVDLQELERTLKKETILISVMMANNEIGTLHPIAEIGKIAQAKGIPLHSDAAQAVGKVPINVETLGVDLLSISAHKIYGPKGVGALYVRKKSPALSLVPRFFGGGHERGLRSGTLNTHGIVGLGKALEIAQTQMDPDARHCQELRDRLEQTLKGGLPQVDLNGPVEGRLPNNLNLRFTGVNSDTLMMELRDVAVSSGSACSSANPKPSHVLKAIGLSEEQAKSSIRFGLGRFTTEAEVDFAASRVIQAVNKLRGNSPTPKEQEVPLQSPL